MDNEKEKRVQQFLDMTKTSTMGRFKIYIGMSAGVGKTYRMLQEAQALLKNGVDVQIGYIETHNRKETAELVEGLPVIPRYKVFYKGKELEELDLNAVLKQQPNTVLVDELAHTNIPGSRNEKRWQDVMELLSAGINVISAVNIQHLESLNMAVKTVTGLEVTERIPDQVLKSADEVVNIDLTADDLIDRLKAGKIYSPDKIQTALNNFFKPESILQLRELALKEVAGQIERKVEAEVPRNISYRHERILACISSNQNTARGVIRKTARLASYYNAKWWVLYIETPREYPDKIPLDVQRHLINNFKLATESGAELLRIKNENIAAAITQVVEENHITTVCMGKPRLSLIKIILATNVFNQLLKKLASNSADLIIMS